MPSQPIFSNVQSLAKFSFHLCGLNCIQTIITENNKQPILTVLTGGGDQRLHVAQFLFDLDSSNKLIMQLLNSQYLKPSKSSNSQSAQNAAIVGKKN